ncbi:hypothetical protein [Alkalihalobacillus sp. CinArs1]|uniref:hypothetical protein n=1 Tax=Alkalihalobacillus sp. CinArs1 TaxID=2995314 RepID=UPI0022DDC534|nr:hypothetical protein [Alkalihalobacillus sp. CinArs1]
MGWTIAMLLWAFGILFVASPRVLFHKLELKKSDTANHSRASRNSDRGESILFFLETKALDAIPWWIVTLFCVFTGLILIVLGVIALVFSY